MLDERLVTLVSSGKIGVVGAPMVVMVVVVVVMVVVVVLVVVVVVVAGARQTQNWVTRGLEGGMLRLGQLEPTRLSSSSYSSAAPMLPPQIMHTQEKQWDVKGGPFIMDSEL